MSPFALLLNELRLENGLRQAELAERMGYEQTYLSAIEVGAKGPPSREFVERLIYVLNLEGGTSEQVMDAWEASHRHIEIPADASRAVYETLNEIRRSIRRLHPAQLELIRFALRMPEDLKSEPQPELRRIKRRNVPRKKEETNM